MRSARGIPPMPLPLAAPLLALFACGCTYGGDTCERRVEGRCLTTLASGRRSPGPIVVDDTNVYWRDSNAVASVPIAGGATREIGPASFPERSLAVDQRNVYWSEYAYEVHANGFVDSAPIAGGEPTLLAAGLEFDYGAHPVVSDGTNVFCQTGTGIVKVSVSGGDPFMVAERHSYTLPEEGLAVSDSSVFWVHRADTSDVPAVMKAPKSGAERTEYARAIIWSIARDDANVYWTQRDGTVAKAPLEGGAPTVLATGQPEPVSIQLDAMNVYWVDRGTEVPSGNLNDGAVMKVPKDGGTPVALLSGLKQPNELIVDGSGVYWTECGTDPGYSTAIPQDGSVMKMGFDGSMPTVLASPQRCPKLLAVDAAGAYWVADSGTVIMSAPRQGSPTVLASRQTAQGTAVDAHNIYWANEGGAVMAVARIGGSLRTLGNTEPSGGASVMAVDSLYLYWFDWSQETVMAMPLTGGSAAILASNQKNLDGLAVDGRKVYWSTDQGLMALTPGDRAPTMIAWGRRCWEIRADATGVYCSDIDGLARIPLHGDSVTVFAEGQVEPSQLALHRNDVFWISAGQELVKVPVEGGGPLSVAQGKFDSNIAFDETHAYWVELGGTEAAPKGKLMRVRLAGGEPKAIAPIEMHRVGRMSVALDATSIYLTAEGDGLVVKLSPK